MPNLFTIATLSLLAATAQAAATGSAGGGSPSVGGSANGASHAGGESHGSDLHASAAVHDQKTASGARETLAAAARVNPITVTHTTIAGKRVALAIVESPPLSKRDKEIIGKRGWIEEPLQPATFCYKGPKWDGRPSAVVDRPCFSVIQRF